MKYEESQFKDKIRNLFTRKISISDFEKWLYNNTWIEKLIGEKMYFDLVSVNFNDKFALKEIEKILSPYYSYGDIEKERIIKLLTKIIIDDDLVKTMGQLYDDYCHGYHFLRILGLSYISLVQYDKNSLVNDYYILMEHINEFKDESKRLLKFLNKGDIRILDKGDYIDNRKDEDKIEDRYFSSG